MQSYMIKVLRVGEPEYSTRVDTPQIATRYWKRVIKKQTWFDENKEHLIVLLLSTKYNVEGFSLASIGTLNEAPAHPRDIFRAAIASGCFAIVVMHNHPSGDPSPSIADHSLTKRLIAAADILQIRLMDHVIVGRRPRLIDERNMKVIRVPRKLKAVRREYFSFKEAGAL